MRTFFWIALNAFVLTPAFAQVSLPAQSFQLEQLIRQSQAQLETIQEILKYSKHDTESLDRAEKILDQLSAGINQSIEKYQGTAIYEKALLQMQADAAKIRKSPTPEPPAKADERFSRFQSESLNANLADLEAQHKLDDALKAAGPGFVPKIQGEAQLGAWRANTRVSTQLSELLTATRDLREDLRAKKQEPGLLTEFLKGVEAQNQKQREVKANELR